MSLSSRAARGRATPGMSIFAKKKGPGRGALHIGRGLASGRGVRRGAL